MSRRGKADSLGVDIYEQIRSDILTGVWAPEERLSPGALVTRYAASSTVLREALTRLAGESFVVLEPNRGFFVRRLQLDELEDLTLLRCHLESLALRLAIERGGVSWESELVAAHHQLVRTPRRSVADPYRTSEEWSTAHRTFHATLIEACRIPPLLAMCANLFDATELYRRWSAPAPKGFSRDVEAEHAGILEATLGRDTELAVARLCEHYRVTATILMEIGLTDAHPVN